MSTSSSVALLDDFVGVEMRAKTMLISSSTTLMVFTVKVVVLFASPENAKLVIKESTALLTKEATAVALITEVFCTC